MGAPKRVAAGLVAGALAVAGLAFTAAPAGAVANVTEQRIQGATRFDTAANVCDSVAPTGAANVLLATGRLSFADALTASGLAGDRNTCILLTEQDALPAATSAQLTQMKSLGTPLTSVTILGGLVAVGQAVQDQVTALGGLTVNRIDGTDRFDTARDIATAIGTPGAIAGAGTVILANGENRLNGADAMAVGPVSARGDGTNPFPILLTNQNSIPTPTLEALAAPGVDNVIVLGGTDAISDAVATQAGTAAGDTTVRRVQGATREDTAVQIAGLAREQGLAVTEVFLANGRIGLFSADALVSGPLGDVRGAATLLTSGVNTLGTAAQTYLDANSSRITTVTAIGGTDVISQAVLDAAEAAAETVANDNNQSLSVMPTEAVTLTIAGDTTDDRQYTVTGLDNTKQYTVALIPAANVTTTGGIVSFADVGDDSNADGLGTSAAATISVANGAVANVDTITVAPVNGTITFTLEGDADGTVIPVVFQSVDGDANLDLNASNQPTEPFGVGGAVNYNPAEGNAGLTGADVPITEVDKTANNLVAGSFYEYDDNDTFFIDANDNDAGDVGEQVTLAQFEAELSVGDNLDISTYQTNPLFVSTFVLEDITPTVPAGLVVTPNASGAVITVNTASITPGATVTAKVVANGAACTATAVTTASNTADASSTTAEYQVNVTGLAPLTNYEVCVSQTVGGETSTFAGPTALDTTAVAETVAPTVTNTAIVSDTAPAGLLTATDTFVMDFSEAMAATAGTQASSFVRVSDSDSTYSLTGPFTLSDGPSSTGINDRLLVNVEAADLTAPVSGTNNGLDFAGGTVTVTLVSADFDDAAGNQVNLAGSADVVVDNEGAVDAAGPTITTATFANAAGVAADFDGAGDTLTMVFDEALGAIVAGDDVTVGGVVLNCGTEVTCVLSVGNTTLTMTWASGTGVTAIVGKNVTAATGLADAAGNGADGFPETVV